MFNYAYQSLLVIALLFFIIRPVGAWISTIGKRSANSHRRKINLITRVLFGWFGIRGVGSLYYLAYAFGNGLKGKPGEQIAWITYTTIVVSVVIHGVSSTPLMNWYNSLISRYENKAFPTPADELE
jgi:NhaP-type Na+/H+ or K+/H+ antiporter